MRGPQATAPRPGSQPAAPIRWVFLDVGNVLLDEDRLTWHVFLRHAEAVRRVRPDRSVLDLIAERAARVAAGSRWPVHDVVASYLDAGRVAEVWAATDREVRTRFAELSPPVVGAVEVVERLSRRYRLGVIANHPPQCRGVLEDLGLLGRCEVVLLAEEQGRYKPDPALFLRALERAEARGAECVMVGDRLDHDIAPAAALGMATAWIRWPDRTAKGWRPDDPEGLAYLESLQGAADRGGERVLGAPSPLSRQGRGPGEASAVQPTMIVDTLADLAAAIERLGEPLS